jgi:DNA-binding transcriptional regulator YiaG
MKHERTHKEESACQLYRHFDTDGRLLYVGISLSAVARLSAHFRDAVWCDQIARVEIESFASRAEAEVAEVEAIRLEKPRYNIRHRVQQSAPPEELPSTPEEVKAARSSLGLTLAQLAAVMGVRIMTVSDWERWARRCSPMAARLLRAYVEGYRPADWPVKIVQDAKP